MYTKLLIAAALLAQTSAAHAVTTFIDFVDGRIGGQVDDTFIDQGLVFSSHGASDNTMNPTFTNEPKFNLGGVGVTDSARTTSGRESFNIRVDFLHEIESISAEVTSADNHSMSMKSYNEFGTLIGSVNSAAAKLGIFETLSFEDSDIAYVVFASSLPYASSPVLKSLTFGSVFVPDPTPPLPDPITAPSSVPLPGALPLLLGGLFGLGVLKRRGAA